MTAMIVGHIKSNSEQGTVGKYVRWWGGYCYLSLNARPVLFVFFCDFRVRNVFLSKGRVDPDICSGRFRPQPICHAISPAQL